MDDDEFLGCCALLLFGFIIVALILARNSECESGQLTVCIGSGTNVTVPHCYDFDLSMYSYELDEHAKLPHMTVTSRNNAHDVVSFPQDSIISYTEKCED